MYESLKFLIEFIRKPTQVGAISPSSKWLARKMVKNNNIKEADTIVELGPGTGVFTSEIICKAHPLSTFF
ncbi:MAG: rRNA adenine N-6-methyltransferase family protein, partial [Gammaproteobacteria bacterium]